MTTDLLLSAGRGPQECTWALGHLLRHQATTRWQIHDALIRGNPTRLERP